MSFAFIMFRALIVSLALSTTEALVGRPSAFSKGSAFPTIPSGTSSGVSKPRIHHGQPLRFETKPVLRLRSTPGDNDEPVVEETKSSVLDKFNDFLDTPILDANNRSNQGAVAEVLKEFVRDEPEIAQVTFSVVVVALMVLATRVATSL